MHNQEYISKKDAAEMLGLSGRRVSEVKGIATRKQYDPVTKRLGLVFRRVDVERVLAERTPVADVLRLAASAPEATALIPIQNGIQALTRTRTDVPSQAQKSGPWLRVPELAAEWDVSTGAILELIRSGELPARRFACRDPWRIHRADAEALRGSRESAVAAAI
jgi:hypothetical protein